MKAKVSSKGQIVLPAELRREDHIEAGQQFEVESISPAADSAVGTQGLASPCAVTGTARRARVSAT